jgi:hypothetical protein
MSAQITEELRDFHRFLDEKLSNGQTQISPEEALDEWRSLHPEGQVWEEDIAAIREALADLDSGERGIPFDEFDREFRQRYQLPIKK